MAQDKQYGGFWARLVALILDNAIVFVILLALGISIVAFGIELPDIVASVLGTLIPLLYWPVLESSRWQATIGKRVMGLEVTDLDGNRLSFLRAFLRSFAKIISIIPLGIGFLIAAFTARKQALHDIIVKTLVVRTRPSQLWKVILALIIGLVLMAASAAGLFYYVVMPMFKKGVEGTMKEAMKGAPPMRTIPAPAPVGKEPTRQAQPAAPQTVVPAAAPAAAPVKPEPKVEPKATPKPEPKAESKATPKPAPVADSKPLEVPAPAMTAAPIVAKPVAERRPARPKPKADTPVAEPAPLQPLGQTGLSCVYKPVMTDEDIARCR